MNKIIATAPRSPAGRPAGRTLAVLCTALLCWTAGPPAQPDDSDGGKAAPAPPWEVRTAHAHVVCHAGSADWAAKLAATLEEAYPVFVKLSGVHPPAGDVLTLHVPATVEAYVKADRELTGGQFPSNLAFTASRGGPSYVLGQPRPEPAAAGAGLPSMMELLAVHEASHQFWGRHVPRYDRWPLWYVEGTAEWVAERVRASRPGYRPERDLWFSSRSVMLTDALRQGDFLPVGRLLRLSGPEIVRQGVMIPFYSEAYALVKYLNETGDDADREGARKFTGSLERILAAQDPQAAGERVFRECFGRELAGFQERWGKWIASRPADWCMVFRDAWFEGDDLTLVAFDEGAALVLNTPRNPPPCPSSVRISADVRIADFDWKQADFILGYRDDSNFGKVAVSPRGYATFMERRRGDWIKHISSDLNAAVFKTGPGGLAEAAVEVTATRSRVIVRMAGRTVLDVPCPAEFDPTLGSAGLGSGSSVVTFRNPSVEFAK